MQNNNNIIDLSILPEEYKKEVIDFYEFILNKYTIEKKDDKFIKDHSAFLKSYSEEDEGLYDEY